MPVTAPLTPFFCLAPIVCRAARVAARFAAAAALASTVSGVHAFGWTPKSASTSGAVPKVAFTNVTNASMKMRSDAMSVFSAATLALVVALAASTSLRRLTIA